MAELDDKVIVTKDKITDIADALREEMSESYEYSLPTMVEKVHELGQGQGSEYTAGVGIDITNRVVSVVDTLMIRGSASGSVASIVDGGANMPLQSCVVSIEPVQSGSGDPSPSNVRPISGWSACNLMRTGKNLVPDELTSGESNGVTITVASDGTITLNGTCTGSTNFYVTNSVFLKGGVTYSLCDNASGTFPSNSSARLHLYQANVIDIQSNNDSPSSFIKTGTALKDSTTVGLRIRLNIGFNYQNCKLKPMLVTGTATDLTQYEQGTSTTYNIDFVDGSTPLIVYGGTLDVTNGVLIVDRAMVDMGTLDWGYSTTQSLFGVDLVDGIHSDNTNLNGICEIYKCVQGYNSSGGINDPTQDNAFAVGSTFVSTNWNLLVRDSRYTDATAFKTAMNGVKCVYRLTTPTTYNVTPTEIKTLLGINNIFADCGDVDVEYVRDATLIINKLLELVSGNNNRTMMKSAVVEKTDEVQEQKKDSVEEDLDA